MKNSKDRLLSNSYPGESVTEYGEADLHALKKADF